MPIVDENDLYFTLEGLDLEELNAKEEFYKKRYITYSNLSNDIIELQNKYLSINEETRLQIRELRKFVIRKINIYKKRYELISEKIRGML